MAQPHNAGENLPEEGSVLGNMAPATLSLLSEQIMNVPTRGKDGGRGGICAHVSFLTFIVPEPLRPEQYGGFACFFSLFRTLRVETSKMMLFFHKSWGKR